MFWVQILYQRWDMQIFPPSVWLVFLLMMQFGAQKFGILMKSPSSVAFMNEFLGGCCLSPKCWHGCFGQFGPALELCFAERIYRPLVPSRHSECPLVHTFFIPFFTWGNWGVHETVGRRWLWSELRQRGSGIRALSHWAQSSQAHVMVAQTGNLQFLARVPRGSALCLLLGSLLCDFGQMVELLRVSLTCS